MWYLRGELWCSILQAPQRFASLGEWMLAALEFPGWRRGPQHGAKTFSSRFRLRCGGRWRFLGQLASLMAQDLTEVVLFAIDRLRLAGTALRMFWHYSAKRKRCFTETNSEIPAYLEFLMEYLLFQMS